MKASPCIRITLTANAGVILQVNRRAVLVDALHDWKTSRFSSVSQATVAAVKAMFSETEPGCRPGYPPASGPLLGASDAELFQPVEEHADFFTRNRFPRG